VKKLLRLWKDGTVVRTGVMMRRRRYVSNELLLMRLEMDIKTDVRSVLNFIEETG